jgi:hypothetical protein
VTSRTSQLPSASVSCLCFCFLAMRLCGTLPCAWLLRTLLPGHESL